MALKKSTSVALACMTGVIIGLAALAILPNFLRKTSFQVDSPKTPTAAAAKMSLDMAFPLVKGGKGATATAVTKASLASYLPSPEGSLIVNFWATWCAPCVQELPSLEYLNRQLKESKSKKIALVTISVDDALGDLTSLFATVDFSPSFTTLWDKSGVFSTTMGTIRFPETYLVDHNGQVLYKWLGPQDWMSAEVIQRLKSVSLTN